MLRIALLAAITIAPLPALADSEWMGSIQFSQGRSTTWTAKFSGGTGTVKIPGQGKFDATKNGKTIRIDPGQGVKANATVKNGKVSGNFAAGSGAKGTISGKRK